MESNKFPPTKATINIPSAPKKLKPPITAPRPLAGAELPIRDMADKLAKSFRENFKKFEEYANDEIMAGAPNVR